MARLITAPLERQLGQIPSLENMSSASSQGLSQITLQFNLDRDINAAGQDVQSAISAAGGQLPQNLPYPPVYAKVNPSDPPVLTIALTSTGLSMEKLSDLADTLLSPRLSQVTGVGRVTVQGNVRPSGADQGQSNSAKVIRSRAGNGPRRHRQRQCHGLEGALKRTRKSLS